MREEFLKLGESIVKTLEILPDEESAQQANALAHLMQRMREGHVEIRRKLKFWLFWNNGEFDKATGYDVSSAMTSIGYGRGALAALDFYEEVPLGEHVVTRRITLARNPSCDDEFYAEYAALVYLYLMPLVNDKDALIEALGYMAEQIKNLVFLYTDKRPFVHMYTGLHKTLTDKYSK